MSTGSDGTPSRAVHPFTRFTTLVLAAGQGTRMRSQQPKVLHRLCGQPLLARVLNLAASQGAHEPIVVLGHEADQVRAALPPDTRCVVQVPQLGTGHAVQMAADLLRGETAQRLLVLYGDAPLLRTETIGRLLQQPVGPRVPLALLVARVRNPTGYGRVLRASDGSVAALVEEAEARADERAIDEIHSGVMLAWTPWLLERVPELPRRSKGEYYLTDLVAAARMDHLTVLAVAAEDEDEVLGINDRAQLAYAHAVLWRRTCERLIRSGVTVLDPSSTYVEPEVEIEPDVVLHPGCHLRGATRVASGCEIGPNALVADSQVGPNSSVVFSVLEGARLGCNVRVGPYSHLRAGAILEDDVELGNYAEVKASHLGAGTKMHHFSYVGDAEVGQRVNIGAGSITANFDGRRKHRTLIGDDAFIGSDTTLRAPVSVGEGAATGAGAVVTRDIPAGETWVGVPARPLRQERPAPRPPDDAATHDG